MNTFVVRSYQKKTTILICLLSAVILLCSWLEVSAYTLNISEEGPAENLPEGKMQINDVLVNADTFEDLENQFPEEDTLAQQETAITTESGDETDATALLMADSVKSVSAFSERERTFPFYRRWWFSLLVALLAVPFLYRYFSDRDRKQNRSLQEQNTKMEEFQQLLVQKEEQISRQESEFKQKLLEEEELKYQALGLSKFSDMMSGNRDEIDKLGQLLISELVKYLGVNMGALYLIKEVDEDKKVLKLLSAYAPDIKQLHAEIHPGEGYVGTCYNEGQLLEVKDVPATYSKISSGLGEAIPCYLAFIPLIQDEIKLGVIEIASFNSLEKYKLEFVQKITQNIASYIAIRTASSQMQEMLSRYQSQAEELQAQEEELRQNLEEMQATQEELKRQMDRNQLIQEDLAREKYLMDALMNNLPDSIYFKDLDSKFIKNSKSHMKKFGVSDQAELVGKSDFDFFSEVHARPAYEAEQNIIATGKPIIDQVEKAVKKDGTFKWVSTTKMPLLDQNGNIVGTFGISKDITQIKNAEMELQAKHEELKAQEEELRQNLEEMQTVQEELERQKAELDWEKHLMDTLLDNLPEFIYFKDKDSKFIKNSLSHAKLFGFSNPKDIIGKSDFDFFADEHARPAFEDEQKIIKTGKPIINLVEKETKKDGSVSWVSTSKMPLYDKKGKIIGTFGISKDITETKKMEMEIQQRNQELQAQEEELRQNLEEMQTIQEDFHRRIQENEKTKAEYKKREEDLKKRITRLEKQKR
ncbi:MAG: PAS domain-containing protein [Bacteroidales bacterium]|nr:PAS domain-containing protein [Bacteroidales bacterium]